MAFASATASNPVALLAALVTFCTGTPGYVATPAAPVVDGNGTKVSLAKNGNFFTFRATGAGASEESLGDQGVGTKGIGISSGHGAVYNNGLAWDKQQGAPARRGITPPNQTLIARLNWGGASVTYHFFSHTSPDFIFVAVKFSGTEWEWMMFGDYTKVDVAGLGNHFFGASWNGYGNDTNGGTSGTKSTNTQNGFTPLWLETRGPNFFVKLEITADGKTDDDDWASSFTSGSPEEDDAATIGILNNSRTDNLLFINQPGVTTGLAVALPLRFRAERGGGLFSPFGEIPNVYIINLDDITVDTVLVIGGLDYFVIPVREKDNVNTNVPKMGLLIRKIV